MASRIPCLVAALAITYVSSLAEAQQPVATRVRGTILSVDGENVSIKTRDNRDLTVHMKSDIPVNGVAPVPLSDVKSGSYIGTTTVPGPDNSQVAVEIHVFPEAQRGVGEGSRPWDLKPNSSMTNGAVDPTVTSNDGHTLLLKFRGGEKKIVLTPETVVVGYVPADRAEIKPGAKIFAFATKNADGSLDLQRISVGKDGLEPPM